MVIDLMWAHFHPFMLIPSVEPWRAYLDGSLGARFPTHHREAKIDTGFYTQGDLVGATASKQP
jgi:hypothetical protein